MSWLQLLDEEPHIGGNYFFGRLRFGGRGKGSDQHPDGHEQQILDFKVLPQPARPVPLFTLEESQVHPPEGTR
jgi:hypothetical protein